MFRLMPAYEMMNLLSLPSRIFISFSIKKNQDKVTEIKINHPEEKQQFTCELLRLLGNRKYL